MFVSMAPDSTASGRACLPHSVVSIGYLAGMDKLDTKRVLWQNIGALMTLHYGGEQLGRFARESGIGAATMTRIKAQKTSVGVDVIEAIARKFKIQPWQVLAPGLGADLYIINDERRVVPVIAPQPLEAVAMPQATPRKRAGAGR